MTFRWTTSVGLALVALAVAAGTATAEVFQLKGGGELVGDVVEAAADEGFVVRTPDGALVAVDRADIAQLTQPPPAAAAYADRARKSPDTVEVHRELAVWCKGQSLVDQAAAHWSRILEIDPDHEEARRNLGYARIGGRWLNRDELMAARGLRMYDGKYRTAQDIAIRQRDEQGATAEVDWFAQIRLWRDWLNSRRPGRAEEAQAQIAAIQDPRAAAALIKLLSQEGDAWIFGLLLDALGRLDTVEGIETLVALSLDHPDRETRLRCLDYLLAGRRAVSIIPYVQTLDSSDWRLINRAAVALARIGDPAAISPLIDALVTRHKIEIAGANPGQIGAAFDPSGGGGGLSFGKQGPTIVERDHSNQEVRRALLKLAGSEDFGYDEAAWRRWFVEMQMHERINSRRDE